MGFFIGILIGLFAGVFIGIIVMSLCVASSHSNRIENENIDIDEDY